MQSDCRFLEDSYLACLKRDSVLYSPLVQSSQLLYILVNSFSCFIGILQLSLTQSDISHIGSMKVEGIVHPTTSEIDLKEEVGKSLRLFFF